MEKTWVGRAITRVNHRPLPPNEVTKDAKKYTVSHTCLIITLIKRVEQLNRS
jgi:hypothetical protein